ncbi:DUF7144 family membrane protein [Kitasatospora sp. NBC_01266]|uniref:DUF7144 family membrane protein n=1 Tax=Kitasatospora sp. NBC_01266 TaxID=2903572 RepID=UPI002E32A23B|nr:hypothetical protein [Kitasatospora sp. NBC_01266]
MSQGVGSSSSASRAGGGSAPPVESHPVAGGLTLLAGVLLIIGGLLNLFNGIAAVAKDKLYVVTPNYVFKYSLTGWGWVHLILGIVVILAGIGLMMGAFWARVVGVLVASLGIIANFMFLPYYPLWALVIIAAYLLVIWAICTAGVRDERV